MQSCIRLPAFTCYLASSCSMEASMATAVWRLRTGAACWPITILLLGTCSLKHINICHVAIFLILKPPPLLTGYSIATFSTPCQTAYVCLLCSLCPGGIYSWALPTILEHTPLGFHNGALSWFSLSLAISSQLSLSLLPFKHCHSLACHP